MKYYSLFYINYKFVRQSTLVKENGKYERNFKQIANIQGYNLNYIFQYCPLWKLLENY